MHPSGMQALLEHSQKTYGPLPFELLLQRRRSRTSSRPSPYPRSRKTSLTSSHSRPSIDLNIPNITFGSLDVHPLQEVSVNTNIDMNILSPPPALNPLKPVSPLVVDFRDKSHQTQVNKENASLGLPVPAARPRVASNARRSALGWSKRSTGKSAEENKENTAHGTLMR